MVDADGLFRTLHLRQVVGDFGVRQRGHVLPHGAVSWERCRDGLAGRIVLPVCEDRVGPRRGVLQDRLRYILREIWMTLAPLLRG